MDVRMRKISNEPTDIPAVSSTYYPALNTRVLPQTYHSWGRVIWNFLCFEKGFTPLISWTPTSASPFPQHYPRRVIPSATLSWADTLKRSQTLEFLKINFLFCCFEEQRPRKFYQDKSGTESGQSTNFACFLKTKICFLLCCERESLRLFSITYLWKKCVRVEYSDSVLSLIREEDVASLWNSPPWVTDLLGRHCPPPWQQNTINVMEKAQVWLGSAHFYKKANCLKSKMYVFNFLQKWFTIIFPHHCIFQDGESHCVCGILQVLGVTDSIATWMIWEGFLFSLLF